MVTQETIDDIRRAEEEQRHKNEENKKRKWSVTLTRGGTLLGPGDVALGVYADEVEFSGGAVIFYDIDRSNRTSRIVKAFGAGVWGSVREETYTQE